MITLPQFRFHEMKNLALGIGANRRRSGAFTMVEVAFAVAIVAFAMVAIMGVLPSGFTVQKSNREDTLINQEGTYLLDAIRNGLQGDDQIWRQVDWYYVATTNSITGSSMGDNKSKLPDRFIVGTLSIPSVLAVRTNSNNQIEWRTNVVYAKIRAQSGKVSGKGASKEAKDFAFSYKLKSEIRPVIVYPWATNSQSFYMTNHLYEVKLTLSWPVPEEKPVGNTDANLTVQGKNKMVFRTMVNGRLVPYVLVRDYLTDNITPDISKYQRYYLFSPGS